MNSRLYTQTGNLWRSVLYSKHLKTAVSVCLYFSKNESDTDIICLSFIINLYQLRVAMTQIHFHDIILFKMISEESVE
ncbi:hypothetical protein CEF21_13130 [Bacillus sp. FJAT-42376]|nr:hypothetical protein CEF21_13130 [Bacillus sp. FJAT-42376]